MQAPFSDPHTTLQPLMLPKALHIFQKPVLALIHLTAVIPLQALLELSAGQIVDLMHLRRLYLTKRGLLVLQRKELVRSIADADSEHLVHPSDTCAKAADVSVSLQENAFQDQQVLYRIARATWCGVGSYALLPPPPPPPPPLPRLPLL